METLWSYSNILETQGDILIIIEKGKDTDTE